MLRFVFPKCSVVGKHLHFGLTGPKDIVLGVLWSVLKSLCKLMCHQEQRIQGCRVLWKQFFTWLTSVGWGGKKRKKNNKKNKTRNQAKTHYKSVLKSLFHSIKPVWGPNWWLTSYTKHSTGKVKCSAQGLTVTGHKTWQNKEVI